jgi:hypothetical protein
MPAKEPEMSPIEDFQLDESPPPPDEPFRDRPSRTGLWVATAIAVVAVGAGVWWFMFRQPPPEAASESPAAGRPAETVEAPEAAETDEDIELPPLDASDALVRELALALSANPDLAAWLTTDRLIRRVTGVVVNVAEGESPVPHVRFLSPEGSFVAEQSDGGWEVAPDSYRRYDRLVGTFSSMDSRGLARLYRKLEPLFDEAYRDLGYPDGRFREPLAAAIRSLLATPVPPDRVALAPSVESYRYADPRFEQLTPAQKLLLRMGPHNVRRVQAKLRELAAALDLEVG